MSRNGSGSYSLPEAAFVPLTAISSSAMNSDLSDIADALTASLARDGQGGMQAVLPLANTGFTYLNDPNTGMRRTAADTQAISCGSVDVLTMTTTVVDVPVALTVAGSPLIPVGFGPAPWSGLTAPAKWVLTGQTLLRATYPALWTFAAAEIAAGNTFFTNGNGSTTFTVGDVSGRTLAGREAVATRLTSSYFGGNSTIVGATGGLESNTLAATNLPPITSTNASQAISVSSGGVTLIFTTSGALIDQGVFGGSGTRLGNNTSQSSANVISTGANSISVTSTGTNTNPHANVQPTIITNFIIYAGA